MSSYISFLIFFLVFLLGAGSQAWGEGSAVRFFAFGDWGSGTRTQLEVASQLKQVCGKEGCDFGLSLGDNFYPSGVSSVEDPQWIQKFKDVYGNLKVPLYAALGNHDLRGNFQAQIDYSKLDPLWIMPDRQFSFRFPASGPPSIEIFVLDSSAFDAKAQGWLKKALASSTAAWKILALHHPILNNGTKHAADQEKLYPKLKPLICGKIKLILSGHEHIFSHLKETSDPCGWEQIILGTGGGRLYGLKSELPGSYQVFSSEASHGFGYFEATAEVLKFRFVRSNGSIAYQTTWRKNK